MVVAIDGPAGAGKSTISKQIALSLNITFLNSGSFYRAITLSLLRNNIDITDEPAVIAHTEQLDLNYLNTHLILNGEDVEDILHSDEIDSHVSKVSSCVEVRHIVNRKIRNVARKTSIVCEGRDITTVVFPDSDYKFYLDASIEAQAMRRFKQGVSLLTLEEIKKTIQERDEMDKNKAEGSLKKAPDAVYIDTSDLTIQQVCEIIISKIHI